MRSEARNAKWTMSMTATAFLFMFILTAALP
jgi:hypothetical protein